jgi:SAM-dependent methyltransferase
MAFTNVYEDDTRASAYARLEFPGTYYLAYRDVPSLIRAHVNGSLALDFGCGAGRSTRFLRRLGFDALGVDISSQMIERARSIDPAGDYRLVQDGNLSSLEAGMTFDVILSAFTFDNVPSMERKVSLFTSLGRLLSPEGRLVNLVSSPDIYVNEWASFTTAAFPENRDAKSGDTVRIVMLDVDDARPVEDVVFSDTDYREAFRRSELEVIAMHQPLGDASEPYAWKSETTIAPWSIYVLGRAN